MPTKAAILAQIISDLPTNGTGNISAATLRGVLANMMATGSPVPDPATQAEAEGAVENTHFMTSLNVDQQLALNGGVLVSLWKFRQGATIWDGVTDAAPALLRALQYVMLNGGIIYVPPGRYALLSQIVLQDFVTPNNADRLLGFGLVGASRRASVFVLPSANTAGAWKITFSAGKVYWTSLWSEIGLEIQSTKTDSPIRVGMDQTPPGGGGAQRHVVAQHVDVYGISSAPIHFSDKPTADFSWTNRPIIDDCIMAGASAAGGDPENYLSSCVLDVSSSYDFRISRCDLSHSKCGINSVGGDQEAGRIHDNSVTGCSTGIRWLRAGIATKTKAITAITKANPAVVTSAGHGMTTGERVFIRFVTGMIEITERWFTVGVTTADTFALLDVWSGANINTSTGYGTYVSGGTAYWIDAGSVQPLCMIESNHIHVNDVGLDICGADVGSQIRDNDIHMSGSDPRYSPGYGIWLQKSQKTTIEQCDIYWPGGPGAASVDIMLDSNGAQGLLSGVRTALTTHYGGLTAVQVTSGSLNVRIWMPNVTSPSYSAYPFIIPSDNQVQVLYSPSGIQNTWVFNSFGSDATRGPIIKAYRQKVAVNGDLGGAFVMSANNSAGAEKLFAAVEERTDVITAGAEQGGGNAWSMRSGSQVISFQWGLSIGSYFKENLTFIPAASATPANNGDATFELTDNTHLKVKVKGSDGVVRSNSLVLA